MLINVTIIIPVYNEENTITELLSKIEEIKNIRKQIIIVDDGSEDHSYEKISNFNFESENLILKHDKNQGKGAAIITAKKYISGDIIIIQDADLEYDPQDYHKLIEPIIKKKTEVVYGSRVLGKKRYDADGFTSLFRIFGNHVMTIISNIFNKQQLSDAHTCYKVFTKNVFDKIQLFEKNFSFCPEITTKIANLKFKIIEVPISYKGRSYEEGKKIKLTDGLFALSTIIKYKFFKNE